VSISGTNEPVGTIDRPDSLRFQSEPVCLDPSCLDRGVRLVAGGLWGIRGEVLRDRKKRPDLSPQHLVRRLWRWHKLASCGPAYLPLYQPPHHRVIAAQIDAGDMEYRGPGVRASALGLALPSLAGATHVYEMKVAENDVRRVEPLGPAWPPDYGGRIQAVNATGAVRSLRSAS